MVHPVNKRVFVDLGCGVGRAVICAAFSVQHFTNIIGIEIVPEMCQSAELTRDSLINLLTLPLSGGRSIVSNPKSSSKIKKVKI